VYQVGINKGIILRCTAYQISRFPENDTQGLKHVGVLTIYRILLIYIYIYIYICCAFVGMDNKTKKHNATKKLLFRIISLVFADFVLGI